MARTGQDTDASPTSDAIDGSPGHDPQRIPTRITPAVRERHDGTGRPGAPDDLELGSTRQLRVAIIAHNRFPLRQPFAGGLESHVWHLVRALAARGHHITLFAAPGSDLDLEPAPGGVEVHDIGTRTHPPWSAPIPDHRHYRSLMTSLIADAGATYDVVHNHAYHYWPILMASRLRAPMLTTLHTSPVLWLKSAITSTGGNGSSFAAVSHRAAQQWREVAGDVLVVDNGVRLADWPIGPGGPYLAWCGRMTPEKGPHAAIDAARRAGMPLKLAGPIGDHRYFRRKIRPHLNHDVTYVGHLDQPRVAELLGGAAAALITPRWEEAYGLVAAEAMACGTPVIAFDRGATASLLTPKVGRVVPPDDTAVMAAAITDLAQISRTDVRTHAETHLCEDTTVDRYLAIYEQLIAATPHPTPSSNTGALKPPHRPRASAMWRLAITLTKTSVADGARKVLHTLP